MAETNKSELRDTRNVFRRTMVLATTGQIDRSYEELQASLTLGTVHEDDAIIWLLAALVARLSNQNDVTAANHFRNAEQCGNFASEIGLFRCFAAALCLLLDRPVIAHEVYDGEVMSEYDNEDRMAAMDVVDAHFELLDGHYWRQVTLQHQADEAWSHMGVGFVPECKRWLIRYVGPRGAQAFDDFTEPVLVAFG